MVLYWSSSDSKTSQAIRTCFSIQDVFNTTIICIVSILPLISSSSNLFIPRLRGSFQAYQLLLLSLSPSCSTAFFFGSLARSKYFSINFCFLLFSLFVKWNGKVHWTTSIQIFLLISTRFLLAGIKWFVCISKNFSSLIFSDRFWFVHISFGCMDKFQSPSQFSVVNFSHPVPPSLEFILCLFTAFVYYLINYFSPHTLHLLLS